MKRVVGQMPWILAAVSALLNPAATAASLQVVDLDAMHADVQTRLGSPLRSWSLSMCPDHRIELRRQGQRWLKLVYGPNKRLWAAAVFQLGRDLSVSERSRWHALRWPGLRPGFDVRATYPPPQGWRPLLSSLGAKQWLWMEASESGSDGRTRLLGGVVVNDASAFAAGNGFPYEVAEAVSSAGLRGSDWAGADMARPLLRWRQRTSPNAYIEALNHPATKSACDAISLALPDYTDFLAAQP